MSKKIILALITVLLVVAAVAVAEQVFTLKPPEGATILQQYFTENGVEHLNYRTKGGVLVATATMTTNITRGRITEAFPPEEIAAWRDEDPEGFAKWAAENAEEYEAWLKANPEYAEKK
jgi:hypothetical protein